MKTLHNPKIAALKITILSLEIVMINSKDGMLPYYDDDESHEDQPETFLDLVKQYAGSQVSESELVAVIDAISPLFPEYNFRWK